MKKWFKAIVWPWQYKARVKAYEERIAELKLAGWELATYSYKLIGEAKYETYEKLEKEYNWAREQNVFAHDKPIDGPRPEFCKYHQSARGTK